MEQYGHRTFPFQMCPPPLFVHIVQINHLRWRTTVTGATQDNDLSQEAYDLLGSIDTFSAKEWAASKPQSVENWTTIAIAFQAAVAIYCISSLQSVSLLPSSRSLRARCAAHSQMLYLLLSSGVLVSPTLNRAMLWPLALLGMEAVHGSALVRDFVREQLTTLSRRFGTGVPLTTKHVLEKIWDSGETCWDACFDKPYIFASQIAVDVGEVSPHS